LGFHEIEGDTLGQSLDDVEEDDIGEVFFGDALG
jgi:hypothetical protein